MSKEELPYAFDVGYKADSSRHNLGSNGLGLTICKLIMERCGGSIQINSEGIGKGTTLKITFPLESNYN